MNPNEQILDEMCFLDENEKGEMMCSECYIGLSIYDLKKLCETPIILC
jgi:hypothetical protein